MKQENMPDRSAHPLDDLFNKKLNSRSFEFKDEYWAAMEQKLDEGKQPGKRVLPFRFLLMGFILIVGLGIGSLSYFLGRNKQNAAAPVSTVNSRINMPAQPVNPSQPVISQTRVNNPSVTVNNNAPRVNSTPDISPVSSNPGNRVPVTGSPASIRKKIKQQDPSPAINARFNPPVINPGSSGNISNPDHTVIQSAPVQPGVRAAREVKSSSLAPSGNPPVVADVHPGNQPAFSLSVTPAATNTGVPGQGKTEPAPPAPGQATEKIRNNASSPGKTKTGHKARKFAIDDYLNLDTRWSFEFYAGADQVKKNLTGILVPQSYVQKRNQQEKATSPVSVGIGINRHFGRWSMSTGLSLLQLGEKVAYDPFVKRRFEVRDPSTQQLLYTYDSTVRNDGVLAANGNTRISYLEIPLMAGYQVGYQKSRLTYTLQGGVSFGILLNARGNYIDTSLSGVFNLRENKSLFSKVTFNFLFAPAINYSVTPKTQMYISPVFRMNVNPATSQDEPLMQRYKSMGMRVGIRYKF